MTPLVVNVLYSESPKIQPHTLYPFKDFEKIAGDTARSLSGGYYKTEVAVRFSNNTIMSVRLDLGANYDHGFKSYIQNIIQAIKQDLPERKMQPMVMTAMQAEMERFKSIQWPLEK